MCEKGIQEERAAGWNHSPSYPAGKLTVFNVIPIVFNVAQGLLLAPFLFAMCSAQLLVGKGLWSRL